MRYLYALALLLISSLSFAGPKAAGPRAGALVIQRPKLILTLVIDQFRADYLTRFEKRFLPAKGKDGSLGGFRYLMSNGAYYPFGEYDMLECMTGPGHATILSGSYPSRSGISLNYWFDHGTQKGVYCTEDKSTPLVGSKKADPNSGQSPKNFIGSTVGDELKNAGLPSRVVSLALKDRAAILMGGKRADYALWVGPESTWVTSEYYVKDHKLPDWVSAANVELEAKKGQKISWTPEGEGSGYSSTDEVPNSEKLGKGFPHDIELGSKGSFATPYGAEVVEAMAERAIDGMSLGKGKSTDLLAVSLSGHDYLGHAFGPNSRELEELTVREDQVVAKLLNHVKKRVPGGLQDVVIVLTGDHGVQPHTEQAKLWGLDAGRIDQVAVGKQVSESLNAKYGKPEKGEWILYVNDLNYWVNREAVREKKLELWQVQTDVKHLLAATPGALFAFTEADYWSNKIPPGKFRTQIEHDYFPGRSGDVVLVPRPYYAQVDGYSVNHVTGYTYDRTVPIILAGGGPTVRMKAGLYAQKAEVTDIAPTLSFLSGVLSPAMNGGRVLHEALSGTAASR